MPSLGDADGVHDAELRRAGIGKARRVDHLAIVVVRRLVAECAPHALERAGIRIEDGDAMIAVTVGHEQFVRRRMDPDVRGPMQIRRVGIALALVAVTDLHDELAVLRELQKLVVGNGLESGQAIRGTRVSAEPDEALVVDMDAMLAFRPFIAVAGPTPGLDVIARGIEHDHRRRGHRGVFRLKRPRTMQHPDVVLRIDRDA